MKIECIIKRVDGTSVLLGSTRYHFKPDDQDRHVAEVDDPDHAKVLLGISEGYRSLDPVPQAQVSLEDALAVLKAQFPGADLSALVAGTATAPVEQAQAPAPAPVEQAQAPTPAPVPQHEADAFDDDQDPAGLSDLSDEELRAEFEKLIGRRPHANMLRENMEAQITAALAETGK